MDLTAEKVLFIRLVLCNNILAYVFPYKFELEIDFFIPSAIKFHVT